MSICNIFPCDGKYNKERDFLHNSKVGWIDQICSMVEYKSPTAEKSKKIVIADCDGILTDGKSQYSRHGKDAKTYGAYDKEAMKLLIKLGWKFYFVSDDKLGIEITSSRIYDLQQSLGVENVWFSNMNANERYELVKERVATNDTIVFFVGDSISDILAMNSAHFTGTTANAPMIVKKYCDYVSNLQGGSGAFADVLFGFANMIFTFK